MLKKGSFIIGKSNFAVLFKIMEILEKKLKISSIKDLEQAAEILIKYAQNRKKWCFYGDLGAGKTTFIKAICAYLKIAGGVTSPTYSLVNEYAYTENEEEKYLYHLDLYRLNSIEEALDIGIEEYLYNEYFCFIEWAEIIEPILPEDVLSIRIELGENETRHLYYS
jgi:tRNA threonylcarbamoyladenosine biosynthesis protein TsaE